MYKCSHSRQSGTCSVPMRVQHRIFQLRRQRPLLEQVCGLSQTPAAQLRGCSSQCLPGGATSLQPDREGLLGTPCARRRPHTAEECWARALRAVCPHGLGRACVAVQPSGLTPRAGASDSWHPTAPGGRAGPGEPSCPGEALAPASVVNPPWRRVFLTDSTERRREREKHQSVAPVRSLTRAFEVF